MPTGNYSGQLVLDPALASNTVTIHGPMKPPRTSMHDLQREEEIGIAVQTKPLSTNGSSTYLE
ncbi:hypothetical protein NECAME_17094 [Necator americanus]|uniref:Uncharacterized protein n=1 Tax=Necator americanus TaxID=51031 RepID=W2TR85_NECAM|nr:hypothetical protein NECAME_17094 [Necator americanus]ETN84565.1 hypothetical protein NECAME_17094 [Necator americanus]